MKKILIVEDVDMNIDLLTQLLEDDYELVVAKDGEQGVVLAQQHKPDLILMDMSLPMIDGYEATRRIRASDAKVAIIGLSAHAMSGDTDKAIAAGCNDYMTKPLNESLLFEKLDTFLKD